jgi:hypothetical protein
MDEGRENNMCVEAGGLPLIKKVLYGVLIDNRKRQQAKGIS